jgi:BTB/POZ domain
MELQCVFLDVSWSFNDSNKKRYTCRIDKATITEPGTEISSFVGQHISNRTNKDVTGIYANNATIEYFPRKLYKLFPNLKALQINNCALKEISYEDLIGLEKLEDLCLDQNQLCSLPSDLFEGMENLREINLSDNKLEFMSSELLDPIANNNLIQLDFSGNTKIDVFYKPGTERCIDSLQELKDIIDKNCESPKDERDFAQGFVDGFKDLWETKNFSDFSILIGSSKEFSVHKCVLAAQSSVFTAIFLNDLKEAQTGKMEIDGFSAEAVEGMLKFMYTGDIEYESIAMDLHAIAAKYDVKKLKIGTEKIILRNINDSNALEVFSFGFLNNSAKIKRKAFLKIKKMIPDAELDDKLMEHSGNLKNFIDAHRKSLKLKAQGKMKSTRKLITK